MLEIHIEKKSFDYPIFEHIHIRFPETGMIGLVGESGCGKSTLLNMIAGLDNDYTGKILYNGKETRKRNDIFLKHYVSYSFQTNYLIKDMKAKSYLAMCRQMFHHDTEVPWLDFSLNQKIRVLSGGEKQRLALKSAIDKQAPILLCDEVTSSLDHGTAIQVMETLLDYSKEHLVIIVSHDDGLLAQFCDHLIELQSNIDIDYHNDDKAMKPCYISLNRKVSKPIYQYKKHQYIMLGAGIFVSLLTLLLMSFASTNLSASLKEEIQSLFPDHCYSFMKAGLCAEDVEALLEDNHIYFCLDNASLEGIVSNKDKLIIPSDYSKEILENDLLEGSIPKENNEIVVGSTIQEQLSLSLNQNIEIEYYIDGKAEDITFTVVGFCEGDEIYFKELGEYYYLLEEHELVVEVGLVFYQNEEDIIEFFEENQISYLRAGEQFSETVEEFVEKINLLFQIGGGLCLFVTALALSELLKQNIEMKQKMIAYFALQGFKKGEIHRMFLCFYIRVMAIGIILGDGLYYLSTQLLELLLSDIITLHVDQISFLLIHGIIIVLLIILIELNLYKSIHEDVLSVLKEY